MSCQRPRGEPSLSDILQDPIVQLLMRRDGVDAGKIMDLLNDVRTSAAEKRPADPLAS